MTDWFLSHTQPQLLLSLVHPSTSESCNILVGVVWDVGTVEKVFFHFIRLILATEHLIVLFHDIFDRGFVRELVDHYGDHVKEDVWVTINF